MRGRAARARWALGWPLRAVALALIRAYRLTLGQVIGGSCRFYPTCSAYAERAVRDLGLLRGGALAVWRVLRCQPLSPGGVDLPPSPPAWRSAAHRGEAGALYDSDIRSGVRGRSW